MMESLRVLPLRILALLLAVSIVLEVTSWRVPDEALARSGGDEDEDDDEFIAFVEVMRFDELSSPLSLLLPSDGGERTPATIGSLDRMGDVRELPGSESNEGTMHAFSKLSSSVRKRRRTTLPLPLSFVVVVLLPVSPLRLLLPPSSEFRRSNSSPSLAWSM